MCSVFNVKLCITETIKMCFSLGKSESAFTGYKSHKMPKSGLIGKEVSERRRGIVEL